jgi:hypothetical protein
MMVDLYGSEITQIKIAIKDFPDVWKITLDGNNNIWVHTTKNKQYYGKLKGSQHIDWKKEETTS